MIFFVFVVFKAHDKQCRLYLYLTYIKWVDGEKARCVNDIIILDLIFKNYYLTKKSHLLKEIPILICSCIHLFNNLLLKFFPTVSLAPTWSYTHHPHCPLSLTISKLLGSIIQLSLGGIHDFYFNFLQGLNESMRNMTVRM